MSVNHQILGIAFSAVPTETINYKQDDLKNEIINLKSTAESKKTDLSYKTNQNEHNNLIAFNDPVNDKLAIVSLDYSTLNKLKSHFGEKDFFNRDDGIIRLNNKAEAFVGGWFADIAYKREFLNADKNKDGNLDSSEYLNTRNEFHAWGELFFNGNVRQEIKESYVNVNSNGSKLIRYNRDDYILEW